MIKWPAIVQFNLSDELEIIRNQSEFDSLALPETNDMRLIDHNGSVFVVRASTDNNGTENKLTKTEIILSAEEAVLIARIHMAAQDQCCVSKFNARTVGETIDALVATDNFL